MNDDIRPICSQYWRTVYQVMNDECKRLVSLGMTPDHVVEQQTNDPRRTDYYIVCQGEDMATAKARGLVLHMNIKTHGGSE